MTAQTAVAATCSVDEARALTDRIKTAAEQTWTLLLEAHERAAWKVLGYSTWEGYVHGEFDMSRGRSYHLLDQARVIRAIEGAVSTTVDITERDVRDIKPHLADVTTQVRERVAAIPDPAPEQVRDVVTDVITETRQRVQSSRKPPTDVVAIVNRTLIKAQDAAELADQIKPAHLRERSEEAAAWGRDLSRSMKSLQRLLDALEAS